MVGIYFSGTGDSRYAVKLFCNEYDKRAEYFSIEDDNIIGNVKNEEMLVFLYPVRYINVLKMMCYFIIENKEL